jgi:putative restriction endonuclease
VGRLVRTAGRPAERVGLNALHDRAFDRGLITFDDDLRAVVSPALNDADATGDLSVALAGYAGRRLRVPGRFAADGEALAYHRSQVLR